MKNRIEEIRNERGIRQEELARQMGGDIHVNSALDRGTTVWIVIPCVATVIEKRRCYQN